MTSIGRRDGTGQSTKYVSIFKDKFEIRYKALTKDNPYVKERTTKDGDVIYVDQFEELTGFLEKIEYDPDSKFGKRLKLHINGDENYIIEFQYISPKNWTSDFAKTFLGKFDNLDLSKEITIAPYSFTPDGSKYNNEGLTIKQDGKKVEYAIDFKDIPKSEKYPDPLDPSKEISDPMKTTVFYHNLMTKASAKVEEFMKNINKDRTPAPVQQKEEVLPEGVKALPKEDYSKVPASKDPKDILNDIPDDDLPF